MLIRIYKAVSIIAPIALSLHTYHTSGDTQFYPTVTHLLSSPVSKLSFYNLALYASYLIVWGLIRVFFGALRPLESESTWEKLYMTLIDSCLALTIFRAEMNSGIVFLFVTLNIFKVFHWIAEMRVKLMETENASRRDIVSVCLVSLTFCLMDALCVRYLYNSIQENGISVKILFLTEYLILFVCMVGIVARVALYFWYRFTHTPWTNRGSSLFYLEILVDLVQSAIYIIFFCVTMIHYSLPLHLMHDLFVTLSSVWKRVHDVYNYRKLAAHFDQRLPNATPEQLANAERCMICFEEMEEAKVLHCNHLFHAGCLRRWLETSLECPMCRAPVNLDEPTPRRLSRPEPPQNVGQQEEEPAPHAHTHGLDANAGVAAEPEQWQPAANAAAEAAQRRLRPQAQQQQQPQYPANEDNMSQVLGDRNVVEIQRQHIRELQDMIHQYISFTEQRRQQREAALTEAAGRRDDENGFTQGNTTTTSTSNLSHATSFSSAEPTTSITGSRTESSQSASDFLLSSISETITEEQSTDSPSTSRRDNTQRELFKLRIQKREMVRLFRSYISKQRNELNELENELMKMAQ